MADDKKATQAAVTPEKVDKGATSGIVVVYRNNFLPHQEQEMPKEDWERLRDDKQLGNAEFIREEPAK